MHIYFNTFLYFLIILPFYTISFYLFCCFFHLLYRISTYILQFRSSFVNITQKTAFQITYFRKLCFSAFVDFIAFLPYNSIYIAALYFNLIVYFKVSYDRVSCAADAAKQPKAPLKRRSEQSFFTPKTSAEWRFYEIRLF